jgi:4,5-DOPA dioxygenase extradiol
MTHDLMPAAFIGHGNPMNTLEDNSYTRAWAAFGARAGRPRGILAISAHWYINATAVTATESPKTIHDFFGFPDELFSFDYPAPGDPALAAEVLSVVEPTWVGLDRDSWGLDHGTWSVLSHMYPAADIPVVQLSVNAAVSPDYHVALGAALAPLRRRGVLILASGNVVHHLGRLDWSATDAGFDWAQRFDDEAQRLLTSDPGDILSLYRHRDFAASVPTPDHFLPVLYLAGLAQAEAAVCETLTKGYAYGSLSMTSYTLG